MDKNIENMMRAMGFDPTPVPFTKAAYEYTKAKITSGRRKGTIQNMAFVLGKHLRGRWGMRPVQEITPQDCQDWLTDMITKAEHANGALIQASTARLRMVVARGFFRWCVRRRMIMFSPMDSVDLPMLPDRPPKCIPPELYAKIREAMKDEECRFAMDFLVATGIRKAEFKKLEMSDLTPEGLMLRDRKARDWMYLPISGHLRVALEALNKARSGGPMFPISLKKLVPDMKQAAYRAEPKLRFSLHTMRHTNLTWLISAGVPIHEVKCRGGHRSIAVAEHYCRMMYKDWDKRYLAIPEQVRYWQPLFVPKR